jgi:hypothetical protein
MLIKRLLLMLLISYVSGCQQTKISNDSGQLVQTNVQSSSSINSDIHSQHTQTSHQTKNTMNNYIYSGAIPENIDIRLKNRDINPLPKDALLKFQVINRGKNPQYNYFWILNEDGKLFLARHSGDTSSNYSIPFDTDLPKEPTKILPANVVQEVKKQLQQADFLQQSPYYLDQTVDDGGFYIITARIDGKEHTVIYEALQTPLVQFLETIESL